MAQQNQIQYSERYYDEVYEYRCAKQRSATCYKAAEVPAVTLKRPFPTRRHVVLPTDIAQLLPKGRLLSEVGHAGVWKFEQ
jgi:hypothetical protein